MNWNQHLKQIYVTGAKSRKKHESKLWLVLVLLLIGWESGAMQNQNNKITFDT